MAWSQREAPDQTGKTFIVTGGNSGLGFAVSKALAAKGAHTILACRNPAKADVALTMIRAEVPSARVEAMALDLSSLSSVRSFAATFSERRLALDGLINNAGVMALPYQLTADGFEQQFGTNHLGHFALTGLLLPSLERATTARVVSLASVVHWFGRIDFDDLQGVAAYSKWGAYAQSKLANLLFMAEFERRLRAHGRKTIALACHPGYAATELQQAGPRLEQASFSSAIMSVGNALLAQSAERGALPTLYAATSPDAHGGDYIGPRVLSMWGAPTLEIPADAALDEVTARRLWDVSETLTKVQYAFS